MMDGDDVWLMRNGFGVGACEGHAAPSGLGFYRAVFPGRCPGLSHYAPLGRKPGPRWGGESVPRWGG
jgi:hypothetical protein